MTCVWSSISSSLILKFTRLLCSSELLRGGTLLAGGRAAAGRGLRTARGCLAAGRLRGLFELLGLCLHGLTLALRREVRRLGGGEVGRAGVAGQRGVLDEVEVGVRVVVHARDQRRGLLRLLGLL